jgi:uncharacterized protein YeaO (DUF488 family)
MIKTKRAYDGPTEDDGYRVLVERLWPRGITKERAALDLWMKDVAPSAGLRKWFGHDPAKWIEFRRRYGAELEAHKSEVESLRQKAKDGNLTLVYGAKDEQHNSASVLKEFLEERS